MCCQPHATAPFLPRKSPRYLLNRRLGGPHSRAARFGGEIDFWLLPKYEPPDHPRRSLVTIPTTLSRPHYYCCCCCCNYTNNIQRRGPRMRSQYSDSLRDGRSGDRIPVGARFSAPVQIGPGEPRLLYNAYLVSFPGVKRAGRGVDHPPFLAPNMGLCGLL
jgi:hypothetical protein